MMWQHLRHMHINKELWSLPKGIKIAGLIALIYSLGWGIADPFFNLYLKDILGSYSSVGLVIGILSFVAIILHIPLGNFMDKISTRKILKIIFTLYLPFSFLLLFLGKLSFVLSSFTILLLFIAFRSYHAFISSSLWLSLSVYVRSHSPKGKTSESIALYNLIHSSAYMIGPLIGGLIMVKYGYSVFYTVSVFAFLALLSCFLLPNQIKRKNLKEGVKELAKDGFFLPEIKEYFKHKKLIRFSLIPMGFYFVSTSIGMLLALFAKTLGANFLQIGLIYALFHIPILFQGIFSVVGDKQGKLNTLSTGVFIGLIVLVTMFFIKDITYLFITSIFLSITFASIIPNIEGKVTQLLPKMHLGENTGVYVASNHFGAALGPILSGVLADYLGLNYVFLLCAFIFLLILIYIKNFKSRYYPKSNVVTLVTTP